MGGRARPVAVPAGDPLAPASYDYADAFAVELLPDDRRTAQQFARDCLDRSPLPLRVLLTVAHRWVLGFPRPTGERVLMFGVLAADEDLIHLEARSRRLHGVLVGRRVAPGQVVVTSYVGYPTPGLSRLLWAVVGPVHRRVAPVLLARAAGRPSPPIG